MYVRFITISESLTIRVLLGLICLKFGLLLFSVDGVVYVSNQICENSDDGKG